MKAIKKWKNLAIATAFGLVIGVQGVMPVHAAEAMPMPMPMAVVTCPNCKSAMLLREESVKIKEEYVSECDRLDHISGTCYLVNATYRISTIKFCPNGHCSEEIGIREEVRKGEHINR